MNNPFTAQTAPDNAAQLIGRGEQLNKLQGFIRNRTDAVLMGPEGSGKSALLRCLFNTDYRMELAQQRILVYFGEFPKGLTGEDSYGYFADAIRSSVEILDFCGEYEEMDRILQRLDRIRFDTKKSRFDQYLDKIHMSKYRMVFVLDNFENFTSSPDIKLEHHDLLCNMLNEFRLQLIVATNYDFNKTSLPVGASNSTLVSRLNSHKIFLSPLRPNECAAYLERTLENAGCEFRFTEEEVLGLWRISGGIPLLLSSAAKYAFDTLKNGAVDNWEQPVVDQVLQERLPILMRWCKLMPDEQLDLLKKLQSVNCSLTDDESTVASALATRGILQEAFTIDVNGNRRTEEGYVFNSEILHRFCLNHQWLQEATKNNPLRREETSPAPLFDISALLGGSSQTPPTIHIENINVDNRTGNTIHNTFQPTIIAGGFDKLFDILDLSGEQLGGRLKQMFTASLPAIIDPDEAAEQISAMFIPEAVESEDLQGFEEECKTLESRFQSVRSKVDPDGLLDDGLLDALSVKCKLYLQIAFVVDDALSVLDDFKLGDLSAQMVMYGKVLEQQLRDNLYTLFHQEQHLKYFDTHTKQENPYSRDTFAFMTEQKTCIGNYMHMIQAKRIYLQNLCGSHGVRFGTADANAQWWLRLGRDVDDARELRNRTDHAGSETNRENLESMRHLLFGNGDILRRCMVGGELTRKLWNLPAQRADDPSAWIGSTVTMTNVQTTNRGSIRGTVAGTEHQVSVSPKFMRDNNYRCADFVGQNVQIRITNWDEGAQKFNAEILP